MGPADPSDALQQVVVVLLAMVRHNCRMAKLGGLVVHLMMRASIQQILPNFARSAGTLLAQQPCAIGYLGFFASWQLDQREFASATQDLGTAAG